MSLSLTRASPFFAGNKPLDTELDSFSAIENDAIHVTAQTYGLQIVSFMLNQLSYTIKTTIDLPESRMLQFIMPLHLSFLTVGFQNIS